ncbi:Gfo/Idh/MocA family protein [Streptomyces sp. NPDC059496]|uniref:Gfo/Idh/MocA family protein n=1 Tax=Streptomyces sp. NPDC059496 TaxID=3346851 RepID=UPI003684FBD1
MRRVGVALVGFGGAGHQHVEALAQVDGTELRGILERDSATGTPKHAARYLSWDQLLRDASVQLVSLCTALGTRADMARQALEAGKAVLMEGVPTASTAELDQLVKLSERTGHPAGVMFPHRFGLPQEVLDWSWQSSATAVLEISRYRPPKRFQKLAWRRGPAQAMDSITTPLGVQYLDLVCQLLGEPAEVKLAGVREQPGGTATRVAGVVRFAAGGVLSFAVTSESAARIERLTVLDVDQSMLIDDGRLAIDGGTGLSDRRTMHASELRAEVYRDLAEAITAGRSPRRCHLVGARAVTMILESMQQQLEAAG